MTNSDLSLAGRVALITGAARGLGRAEALALASRGAQVALVDVVDPAPVRDEVLAAGGAAVSAVVDLAQPGAADRAFQVALDAFGDVDVIVNNAGVVRDRMSFNLSDEDWALVLGVNLSASFYLSRAAIRHWRNRAADKRPRAIVNTSSESGLFGNAGQANYASAKAGVAALTVTLATELDRYGIRVNAIAPRARTPMSSGAFGELPSTGDFDPLGADHVAAVVAWLASDAAGDVTGQVLVVHGTAIDVMVPWTSRHRLAREGAWTDDALRDLKDQLFPDRDTRQLATPVGDLFTGAGR